MKNKKNLWRTWIDLGFFIIVLFLIFLVVVAVLSNFTKDVYRECCEAEHKGKLIMWECYNSAFTNCSNYRQGWYCDFGNGTQIKINELNCSIQNITYAEN